MVLLLDDRALNLLEAAYQNSSYQEVEGRRILVALLDGQTAMSVGVSPTTHDTPEGHEYQRVIQGLEESGAVEEISYPRYQGLRGTTYYEITQRGLKLLHETGREK